MSLYQYKLAWSIQARCSWIVKKKKKVFYSPNRFISFLSLSYLTSLLSLLCFMVCCGSALSLLPKRDLCLLPIIAHRQSLLVANLCRSSINNSPSSATSLACRWMYQWWMGTVWMGLVWGFGWVCFCGGPVVLDGYGL